MAIVMMQRAKRLTCCPITLTFSFSFSWNSLCFHSAANIEGYGSPIFFKEMKHVSTNAQITSLTGPMWVGNFSTQQVEKILQLDLCRVLYILIQIDISEKVHQ